MFSIAKPGRRQVAVLLVATLATVGVVMLRSATGANADTRVTTIVNTCPIIGAQSSTVTATDTPDPAVAGGTVSLEVSSVQPATTFAVTILSIASIVPIPAQVATVDSVTFTGGNFAQSYTVAPDNTSVTLNYTGPVLATVADGGVYTIHATLKPGTEGQTVTWLPISTVTSNISGLGTQVCTSNATNPPIQETLIQAAATTTTSTAPTTTTSTTTTTVPTTSTTTTTVPTTSTTTTTTVPTTSTTTTTTVPTTSTTTTTRPTTTSTTTTTTVPTTSTTTTTRPTTSSTTTTTTRPTTSSTTSTTRPTTSSTRATTSTTRSTTTTTGSSGGGLIALLKWLLCYLFHIC